MFIFKWLHREPEGSCLTGRMQWTMYRDGGTFVGKILKGAKPADLPVEQRTKYEMVDQSQEREGDGASNCRPRSWLRADEVIE